MAGRAHLSIFPTQCGRIKPWAVRIEAPASKCRMAGETVPFRMTRNAAFQVLSRRLTVPQEKGTSRIVIPGVQLSSCAQPRIDVAVSTELRVVVAVAAIGLPGVGRRWVPGEKPSRVITRRAVGGVRPVAVEALRPHMTALARLRPAVRHRPVGFGKILPV